MVFSDLFFIFAYQTDYQCPFAVGLLTVYAKSGKVVDHDTEQHQENIYWFAPCIKYQ